MDWYRARRLTNHAPVRGPSRSMRHRNNASGHAGWPFVGVSIVTHAVGDDWTAGTRGIGSKIAPKAGKPDAKLPSNALRRG